MTDQFRLVPSRLRQDGTKAPVAIDELERANFTVGMAEKVVDLGEVDGAVEIDLAVGNYFKLTVTDAVTLSIANPPAAGRVASFILKITNGGTNVTFPDGFQWPAGATPDLTADGTDFIAASTDDEGTTFDAVARLDSKAAA